MRRIARRLSPSMAVAVFALVFAMGGGAYAAKRYLINSTKQINPRVLRALKGRTGATGAQGPQGPPGAKGDPGQQGPPGAAATTLWAVVNSDGTLARGSHVTSTLQVRTGGYGVLFDRDVSSCAYEATLGDGTVTAANYSGNAAVTGKAGSVNGVFVNTFDTTGTATNYPFHVAVFC
jgi:hypothetical protein